MTLILDIPRIRLLLCCCCCCCSAPHAPKLNSLSQRNWWDECQLFLSFAKGRRRRHGASPAYLSSRVPCLLISSFALLRHFTSSLSPQRFFYYPETCSSPSATPSSQSPRISNLSTTRRRRRSREDFRLEINSFHCSATISFHLPTSAFVCMPSPS